MDTTATLPVADAAADDARRFGGVARLYGAAAAARFAAARIAVVGVGGVGSWAVEALARSAVGALTLIDLDQIAVSNTNRQLQALGDAYGQAKVDALAARIAQINPACRVTTVEDFVTPDNVDALLGQGFDCVIDCIDDVRAKTALIAWCRAHGVPLVVCGSAGGQLDPTRIQIADLAKTIQDPLLARVRTNLRRDHGFARGPQSKFGIDAVFSDEPLRYPDVACDAGDRPSGPQGLNCAGFGSSVCVTAAFGFAAASRALALLAASA